MEPVIHSAAQTVCSITVSLAAFPLVAALFIHAVCRAAYKIEQRLLEKSVQRAVLLTPYIGWSEAGRLTGGNDAAQGSDYRL